MSIYSLLAKEQQRAQLQWLWRWVKGFSQLPCM